MQKSCPLLEWAETKFLTKQAVQWDKLEAKCFTLGSPGQFTVQILYISLLPNQQPCSDTTHLPSPPLKAWTFPGLSQHMALHKGVPREDLALAMTNPPLLHYQSAALHPSPSTGLTRVQVLHRTSPVCLQLCKVPVNRRGDSQNTASP